MPNVLVGKSRIHGQGAFAARDFQEGEVVLTWDTSHVISEQEAEKLSEEEKQYVSRLEDGGLVLMQPPEKFVNHSCESNTVAKDGKDIALKNIKEGEEITSDYSDNIPVGWEMECHCGSAKCRKRITAK